ncbi:alpha,alpha-trehalase TreF [Salegentibacter chungangensis]|uniref:Alpha,alpha-trehalase TreF n=1 Tax=Salegentibacter chungangensis TaxID=1335724 RepID=A0ABW3NRG6_9FLAO
MNNYLLRLQVILYLFIISSCSSVTTTEDQEVRILPPEELYGDLFYEVQTEAVFPDSKTFVDAVPLTEVDLIKEKFKDFEPESDSALYYFVEDNFRIPGSGPAYKTDSSSINTHIKKLWEVLKRPADEERTGTLIPLPEPYIVPGGRFREIYYWDSYFTMLGLLEDGEVETIQNMVDNFSHLLEEYGFIPNGNRTYYLGRSQPPFYAMMVGVLAEAKGEQVYADYLEYLEKEYDFWMSGTGKLSAENNAHRRVVRLPDGEILNRYWDDKNTPRPESFREDVETAREAVAKNPELTKEEVYRNLRAGAESGWDFSSRWLTADANGEFKLSTIHTTAILPVDLNSLLYNLESVIAKAYDIKGNKDGADKFLKRAEQRALAIEKYFWSEKEGYFMDYNFKEGQSTGVLSMAGTYPLFFEIASEQQAEQVTKKIREVFLKPGGLVTTPNHTGQQWDAPNGWAPLQWIGIKGLRNYGQDSLANEIRQRWLHLNERVYKNTFKMMEKYNVEDLSKESGGGEYPTQDGFGWSNGVYRKLAGEEK